MYFNCERRHTRDDLLKSEKADHFLASMAGLALVGFDTDHPRRELL